MKLAVTQCFHERWKFLCERAFSFSTKRYADFISLLLGALQHYALYATELFANFVWRLSEWLFIRIRLKRKLFPRYFTFHLQALQDWNQLVERLFDFASSLQSSYSNGNDVFSYGNTRVQILYFQLPPIGPVFVYRSFIFISKQKDVRFSLYTARRSNTGSTPSETLNY